MAKKIKRTKNVATSKRNKASYEVDIAQEFKDVKNELKSLKTEITGWKSSFDLQLTKLNDNMEKVLSTIADHERRLTELEQISTKNKIKKETLGELAKFCWWAAKWVFAVGILFGAAYGTGILKLICGA